MPDDDASDGDASDEETQRPLTPHVVPEDFWRRRGEWARDALFNAERGSIGLAWSIFKLRGTPNEVNWPVSTLST